MGLLKKKLANGVKSMTPIMRSQEAVKEISAILEEYNCRIDIGHTVQVLPIEEMPDVIDAKESTKS